MFLRYGISDSTGEQNAKHKKADRIAAASEAVHVVGWTKAEVRNTLRIPHKSLTFDPLVAIYGGTPWEPSSPGLAAERFLTELSRLLKAA